MASSPEYQDSSGDFQDARHDIRPRHPEGRLDCWKWEGEEVRRLLLLAFGVFTHQLTVSRFDKKVKKKIVQRKSILSIPLILEV